MGRGGAGCVSCCVCAVLLRRGGRCPCCAGRRRGLVQLRTRLSSCPLLCKTGIWSRQCRSWSSAVAVLDKVLTCPLVASGARSWCASATDHGVYCGGDSSCALLLGADRGVPAPQIVKFIVEVMPLVRDAGEQIVVFSATDHGVYCRGHAACA